MQVLADTLADTLAEVEAVTHGDSLDGHSLGDLHVRNDSLADTLA